MLPNWRDAEHVGGVAGISRLGKVFFALSQGSTRQKRREGNMPSYFPIKRHDFTKLERQKSYQKGRKDRKS